MAIVNHETREVTFKIVYAGTPVGGKTTNLAYVHSRIEPGQRGDMVSLATSTDRTLFFDFVPINTLVINGYQTKFLLYTVPGQVFYDASRKLILKGVDGVVFVADSQIERTEANLESIENLRGNLAEQGYDLDKLPFVMQYNKRDLPNVASIEELRQMLNPTNVPEFEACARTGEGVFETLKAVAKLVMAELRKSSPSR